MKDRQGIQRGKCNECECEEYIAPSEQGHGLRCEYCNHTPVDHVRIIPLGECNECGKDNCDKYVSEDPNKYTECQYCGCDAGDHAGADKLVKPKQNKPDEHVVHPSRPAVGPQLGGRGVQAATGDPGSRVFQPRMSASGQVLQTTAHGTCSFPGCSFPKRIEENGRVLDYCSKTCAQKAASIPPQYQQQPGGYPAPGGGGYQHQQPGGGYPASGGGGGYPASGGGGGYPASGGGGGKGPYQYPQQPGQPGGYGYPASGRGRGGSGHGGPGGQLCKKCNARQANPGRGWCQQCYSGSTHRM